jgi:hypothetical protein
MEYGYVTGNVLTYKGKLYQIDSVVPTALILKTDKLFGKYGDEFPLSKIKTPKKNEN